MWTPTHAQSRIDNAFLITATSSEGRSATQSFILNPKGNINGKMIPHVITGAGLQNYPRDLSAVPLEALIPTAGGGYTAISGTGDANGNFTVQNVPGGNLWMHFARKSVDGYPLDLFVWTPASDLDLGGLVTSRPDRIRTQNPVNIVPNVNLSVAPLPNDYVLWTSPDVYTSEQISGPISQPFTTPFLQYGYLIDASKNDRAYLVHYNTNAAGVSTVAESIAYNNITETNGGSVNLTGSMASGSSWTCYPIVSVTQFDSVLANVSSAFGIDRTFTMTDVGYDGSEGYAYSGVPLISADLSSPDNATADADLGTLSYQSVTSTGVPYVHFVEWRYRFFADTGEGWGKTS